jgi:hypothetical protein
MAYICGEELHKEVINMGMLVKKIRAGFGQDFENVYFKVDRVNYFPKQNILSYCGFFYLTKEAADQGFEALPGIGLFDACECTDKTANLYEYVYKAIKEKAKKATNVDDYIQYGEHHPDYYANYNIFKDAQDM